MFSYFASCLVFVRVADAEVVLFVVFDLELLLVPDVLLLMIFPARLLLALRRFLDRNNAFLELLIFIFYSCPFLFAFSCFFVRSGSILVYVIYIGIIVRNINTVCKKFLILYIIF